MKKIHPLISQNIRPNIPLTPQVISSINLLHQQQQVQCTAADTNIGKSKKNSKLSLTVKAKRTSEINVSKDASEKVSGKPESTLPMHVGTPNISSDVPSSSTTTMMTVQSPLTIDFNDLNGYFTTSSTSENQPNQEGDYMIYKLI